MSELTNDCVVCLDNGSLIESAASQHPGGGGVLNISLGGEVRPGTSYCDPV